MVSNKNILVVGAMLLMSGSTAMAQSTDSIASPDILTVADSTQHRQLVDADTIIYQEPSIITTKIRALARAYGDSIALRWVPEDYVSWRYLCQTGVNILRTESNAETFAIDTLAYALKPLSEEAFRAKYAPNDSNALVAQGILYGEGRLGANQTENFPGSMGASMEYNNEQDLSFAFAMLVAEWRPDLARDMAVGFLDRTAQPGKMYDYYIQPTQWDTDGRLIFEPGVAERVRNHEYTPDIFDPRMVDSISSPRRHVLGWWDDKYSTYDIYRRHVSDADGNPVDGAWKRINQKPYLSIIELPEGDDYKAYSDSVPSFGVYEYFVVGHDPFGTANPSLHHLKVNVYDNEPPSAPQLKGIVIDYPDDDIRGRTRAHIIWEKDTIEGDLQGYVVRYYNAKISGETWIELNDKMIPPTDTMFVADVTGLRTGMLQVAAYDLSGNEATSFSQLIELHDFKAPAPPDSLTAQVVVPQLTPLYKKEMKHAYVILRWKPNPADDDIMHYDIAFANDTTHAFQRLNEQSINAQWFIDSLALDANQKYIYYKVRATDYSTNEGEWSPWIQVKRPHLTPPTQPHLERSNNSDEEGIHMEWVIGTDADMEYHKAFRRRGEVGEWELIGRYDHDSLTAHSYTIVIDDRPEFDRQQRYYYYVESFNSSPFTSKSLAVSFLFQGPKIWDVSLKLIGDYDEKTNQTRLVWDTGKLPFDAPYYYCIYRRAAGEERYEYMGNVPADTQEFTDQRLKPGEQAEYYVMIQWRDGRQSTLSNTITVKRSEK